MLLMHCPSVEKNEKALGRKSKMQNASYVRMYADASGESHFEDIDVELVPVDFAPPAGPLNVANFLPTAGSFWLGIPTGWDGITPHPSPQRQIFCVLQGECEVTVSDGDARRLTPGSVVLLEDTTGKGHSTRVIGGGEILIFGVVVAST